MPSRDARYFYIAKFFKFFCGYIVGFVVSFLLEAFLTGGTVAVADIAARVSRIIAGTGTKIRRLAELSKEAIKKGADVVKFIRELISSLLALVKKDPKLLTKKFIDILDKIGIAIRKELGLASEFADIRKIADDFNILRKDFKNADLKALWRAKVIETKLPLDELKKLFNKRIKKFPGLMNYHNQAEFRTIIKKNGQLVEDIKEYFISGDKKRLTDNFGNPPKLPDDLVDVIDDYDNFSKFAQGAVDKTNRSRNFDSELKYIYNFIKKHANKGDEFVVDITSLIKVCNSCSRELLMLEEYMIYRGKSIKFVIRHDVEIDGFKDLLTKIKIK
jgi:hypothetical protein